MAQNDELLNQEVMYQYPPSPDFHEIQAAMFQLLTQLEQKIGKGVCCWLEPIDDHWQIIAHLPMTSGKLTLLTFSGFEYPVQFSDETIGAGCNTAEHIIMLIPIILAEKDWDAVWEYFLFVEDIPIQRPDDV